MINRFRLIIKTVCPTMQNRHTYNYTHATLQNCSLCVILFCSFQIFDGHDISTVCIAIVCAFIHFYRIQNLWICSNIDVFRESLKNHNILDCFCHFSIMHKSKTLFSVHKQSFKLFSFVWIWCGKIQTYISGD